MSSKKIFFIIFSFAIAVNLMAVSQIKIICDKDSENIYLNGKFKAECDKDEVVRLMVKEGKYTVIVKKRDKEARYSYEKSFRIGDGVQKVIEPKVKAVYNEYHYYHSALKQESLEACKKYLKNYPNGKYKKEINEIKTYILAKKDFRYFQIYKRKYPGGKFLQKIKEHYLKYPLIATLRGHRKSVRILALTKDSKRLFSGGNDENIIEWDLNNFKILKKMGYSHKRGGELSVSALALSPDEKYLYSNGRSAFRKWDIKTGHDSIIADYSPEHIKILDTNHALTLRGDRFDIWDLKNKKILFTYKGNDGYDASMNAGVLSKDKRYFYFAKYSKKLKRTIIVKYDLKNKKIIKRIYAPQLKYSILSLAITPDNRYLISGTRNDSWVDEDGYLRKTVIVWDLKNFQPYKKFKQKGSIYSLAVSPDGRTLAIGTSRGEVFIADIKSGLLLKKIDTFSWVNDLVFTKDGKELIGALGNGNIDVWYVGFYNKTNLLSLLLKECKNGAIFACNNYLKNGGKKIQVAKNALLKKFKSILKSYGSDITYKDPKIYINEHENRWRFYYSDTQNALYKVETIISNDKKVYVVIDVDFKKTGFTFNAPIYLIQNGKKKNYTKRFPKSHKIKVGTKHIKLIFVYDNFPLQKGYYKIIEKDESCKGCMNFSNGNIVEIF